MALVLMGEELLIVRLADGHLFHDAIEKVALLDMAMERQVLLVGNHLTRDLAASVI